MAKRITSLIIYTKITYKNLVNHCHDPSLVTKLPFKYNKFEVDIYKDDFPISIFNIQKFMNMTCDIYIDIYIDKVWKFNDRYICKWQTE